MLTLREAAGFLRCSLTSLRAFLEEDAETRLAHFYLGSDPRIRLVDLERFVAALAADDESAGRRALRVAR